MEELKVKEEQWNKDVARKNIEIRQRDKALEQKEIELQKIKLESQQKDKEIEELTNLLLHFLPDARMCKVEDFPNQMFTNKEAVMTVTLKNSKGKPISNNRDSLSIIVKNQIGALEKTFLFNVTELQNGCYNVCFIIKRAGYYSFSVRVRNEDIHGFPCRYVNTPCIN